MKKSSYHKGFTLTELLVVITIIAILATLGFMGVTRMRKSADKVTVTRNLSQFQLANLSYASENNGQFVAVRSFNDTGSGYLAWFEQPDFVEALRGYAPEVMADGTVDVTLPTGLLDPTVVKAKKRNYLRVSANYGYNCEGQPNTGSWSSPNSTSYYRTYQLTAPERSAAFFTATDWQAKYSGRFLWRGAGAVEGGTPDGKIAYRYDNKALVAYYDGHVDAVSMEDMRRFDQQGGIRNLFWDADVK